MFDLVTEGFKSATLKLKGQTKLNAEILGPALKTVRDALLDADVDFTVATEFVKSVETKALGEVVTLKAKGKKVSAEDHFIKLCHNQLVDLLGQKQTQIIKNEKGPTVVLLAGLQGAGKTTHAAKLAKLFKDHHNLRPLLVAADVYRPAAREQLRVLAERIEVPFFSIGDSTDPVDIARQGIAHAREQWRDVVIIDTAGRLAIDEPLMAELEALKGAVSPQNILLVLDAMIGQDAVRTATVFDQRLGLTGVILTKCDGDARGGAALSVKKITGKSILFVGTGEAVDRLEEFRPDGMASRILGMGDVVGLMQDFERAMSEEEADEKQKRLEEGEFDFNDFLDVIGTVGKMGPIQDIIAKTPFAGQLKPADMDKVSEKSVKRKTAMVQSMTAYERSHPEVLLISKSSSARSRVNRIARGSNHTEKDVRDLVDQFMQMRNMMQMMSGGLGGGGLGGLFGKMPGLGQLNQMASMAKMAKMMAKGGGAGMPGIPPGLEGLGDMSGMRGGNTLSIADLAEINRLKKRKKEEKLRKQKKR